ncbi:MAG: hypothetical protein ABSG03_29690 [Bryobacteraceae bacterium]|jgi:CheY-like chemotaxis protein
MPTSPRPIRILTVDDHALLRVGIAALVSREADMELVGEACNGQEALEKYRLHPSGYNSGYNVDGYSDAPHERRRDDCRNSR